MVKKIKVTRDDTLLNFLLSANTNYNRAKLKMLLKNKCISVNDDTTTKFDYPIFEGQCIIIDSFNKELNLKFKILYEDNYIIVIDKPSGILSIPAEKEDRNTAFDLVRAYEKVKNPRSMIYSVHRLDQGTSGVLMFAKDEKTKRLYQTAWNTLVKERMYVAYVEGKMKKTSGTITSLLKEGNRAQMHSSRDGKKAVTHYKVMQEKKDTSILNVCIDTGRQNQIRVHLSDLGNPIVGDIKYNALTNPMSRLGLHAYRLKIINPYTKEIQMFCAPIPNSFGVEID